MMNDPRPLGGSFFQRLATAVLRTVVGVAGLLLFVFLMVFGLVAGSLLVIWALLRGRRPKGVRFGVPPGARWGRFDAAQRGGSPWQRTPRGEVVDVQARDVTPRGPTGP